MDIINIVFWGGILIGLLLVVLLIRFGVKKGFPIATIIFVMLGVAMIGISVQQLDENILFTHILFAGIVFIGLGGISFQVHRNKKILLNILKSVNRQDSPALSSAVLPIRGIFMNNQ